LTASGSLEFWKFAVKLKTEPRKGWTHGPEIERIESVADHSFGVAILCLLEATARGYDVGRALALALLHDIEESVIGDLTPQDKKKLASGGLYSMKVRARSKILRTVPRERKPEFRRLWTDLDRGKTKEARLVKDLDKLEMALQASQYESLGTPHSFLVKFYKSAMTRISDDSMKRIIRKLGNRRN